MPRPTRPVHARRSRRLGFTLLELLIVIAIITILIVLSVGIALKVSGVGKRHATESTLRVLDTALNAYVQAKGTIPPAWVVDPRPGNPTNNLNVLPVVDGRNMSDPRNDPINSVGLFLLQCKDSPEATAALKNLDPKYFRDFDPDVTDTGNGVWTQQPTLTTVFDAWGHPIRYVHPVFKGLLTPPGSPSQGVLTTTILPLPAGKQYGITSIRRNNAANPAPPPTPGPADAADSDGGVNPSSVPYFYSAGPDGDPSTTDDNIYVTAPRFQKSN